MKKRSFLTLLCACLLIGSNVYAEGENVRLIKQHPSDNSLFTEGLERLPSGELLFSTGKYGESRLGILDPATGKFEQKALLNDKYFGEGIASTPDGIWQLTYHEHKAFKRDPKTYKVIQTVEYEGEGWGLTYNKEKDELYMSNGSDEIQVRKGSNFELIKTIKVTHNDKPLRYINELEYANGKLYANVLSTFDIHAIDLETGKVEKTYDLQPIVDKADIKDEDRQKMDAFNGIAHIEGNRFYVTGKNYPAIFEVELN